MLPPARAGLTERVRGALELFPADLLFVHRDADREPTATRRDEIRKAVEIATPNQATVPVVPVRMTEAWLLIDEPAIRSAAGNPRGTMALDLPKLGAIEGTADPKNIPKPWGWWRNDSPISGRCSGFRLSKSSKTYCIPPWTLWQIDRADRRSPINKGAGVRHKWIGAPASGITAPKGKSDASG